MFPPWPGSWKWAGRANKQRGGAHARQTNTFTYVYSHKQEEYTHHHKLRLKGLYVLLQATLLWGSVLFIRFLIFKQVVTSWKPLYLPVVLSTTWVEKCTLALLWAEKINKSVKNLKRRNNHSPTSEMSRIEFTNLTWQSLRNVLHHSLTGTLIMLMCFSRVPHHHEPRFWSAWCLRGFLSK